MDHSWIIHGSFILREFCAESFRRSTFARERKSCKKKGIECRKDRAVIDESPAAYKDISSVIAAQQDLIEVVHTLRQVVNVKG